jgi:hypothetical protein
VAECACWRKGAGALLKSGRGAPKPLFGFVSRGAAASMIFRFHTSFSLLPHPVVFLDYFLYFSVLYIHPTFSALRLYLIFLLQDLTKFS